MKTSLTIVCPFCDTINRVPGEKTGDNPVCGKCRKRLFNGKPVELTNNNFQKHIEKNSLPVVVDFWAPWCGPCKMMAPVFIEVSKALEPRLRVAKLNTENETIIASRYKIQSIPTIIIFKAGREIKRISGAMQLNDLTRWINENM